MIPCISSVERPLPKSKRGEAPMRAPADRLLKAAFRALNKRPLTPDNREALRSISLAVLFLHEDVPGR
jgi:hypothetical protein